MIPVLFPCWLVLSALFFAALYRVLGLRWIHRGEELFFAAASSLAWMSFAAVGLGLFGQARPAAMIGAAAGTGAAALVLLPRARRAQAPPPVPRPAVYGLCAAFLVFLPLVFLPPFFYDALRYHDALPAVFLRTGSTLPLPHFVESNYPLGGEMLTMIGMSGAGYAGANAVNLLFFALCGLGMLCLADRLGARRAGWIGLLLFLASSTAVHTLFIQKLDLYVTLSFLSCAYALLAYRQAGGDRKVLLLAAALGGACLGTKYTAVLPVGVALVLALAERRREDGAPVPRLLGDALLFVAAAAVLVSPWLVRNLVATGNPVYPLLNGVFHSPTWSPARMRVLVDDSHPLSLYRLKDAGRLLLSVTFFPDIDLGSAGASLGAGVLALFLFPVLARRPDPAWRYVRNVALGVFAAWFLSSWITRYLLPALPFMALMAGLLADRGAARAGRAGPALLAAMLAAAVLAQGASAAAESSLFRAWRGGFALVGRPDRAAVIAARFDQSMGAARFVNSRLPERARILFLGETRLYYFDRDADVPSPFDEHPLEKIAAAGPDPESIRRELAARGYTHLLVHWGEWDRLGRTYFALLWTKEEIAAADRFAKALPPVYSDRYVTIFSLETPL